MGCGAVQTERIPDSKQRQKDSTIMLNNKRVNREEHMAKMKKNQPKMPPKHNDRSSMPALNYSSARAKVVTQSNKNNATTDISLEAGPIKRMNNSVLTPTPSKQNREYFKRPLKLIKKKMQESKRKVEVLRAYEQADSFDEKFSMANIEPRSCLKKKSQTEHQIMLGFNDEVKISTKAAQIEKQRMARQKVRDREQRQAQNQRWKEQLQEQQDKMREEKANRYAYYRKMGLSVNYA